jgi:glycosyltransferase involved in cell wall biosynthesis
VSADLARFLEGLTKRTSVVPVPNTVDPAVFAPRPSIPSDELVLITVGKLIEVKGQRYLIDALRRLQEAGIDAKLHIVGDGDLRQDLVDQIDGLQLTDRVKLHGYLPKAQIAELMRSADVFVLPSLWENLPCVVLEAMASGLPVVATRVGGVQELIDARLGLLVEPASPSALADAIAEVAQHLDRYDPDTLHALAASRYGPESVARQWAQVYQQALASGRPRGRSEGSQSAAA